MQRIIFILWLLSYLSIQEGHTATYYVSNQGNDNANGLSLNDAWQHLQYAADQLVAGDTLLVADGTYTGFAIWAGGTAQAPIVIKTIGNSAVINLPCSTNDGINVENADYVIIDGFRVIDQPRNGIRLALADHCVVRNCICDNNFDRGIFTGFTDDILIEYNICTNSQDEHGIYVSNSSDRPIIRYNECYGNNNIGIHMNGDLSAGGDGIISDAQVYGNIIHDNNLAAGINMDGLENPLVYNNVIYNNHSAQGIALFQQDGAIATRGAKIYHNTIIVPSDGRWGILVNTGSNTGTEVFNNIIINQHAWRGCITTESTTDFSSDYNILQDKLSDAGDGSTISLTSWQNLGLDMNSLLADPLSDIFVNPILGDFHLGSASQAVDAGTTLGNITVDIAGNIRPTGMGVDIGAFEQQPITSTHEAPALTHFNIFPNPLANTISLPASMANMKVYSIYGLDGKCLQMGSLINHQIHIEKLADGLYTLILKDDEGELAFAKFVVQR